MVIIIGGGISGLATGWFLHRQGVPVRILEAGSRVGGVINTRRQEGFAVECGPNSTLRKPGQEVDAIGRLVADAGFDGRFVVAGKEGGTRFVLRDGRLQEVPASPPAFLSSGLFSWRAKMRLMKEPFIGTTTTEETIAEFVERRLGQEFLDYAIEPFISGVYAGDPRALSVQAAVPRIYGLEQTYGSLIRGAFALGKAAKGAGMPAGGMYSFDDGMSVLPESIAAALPEGCCQVDCTVKALEREGDKWKVVWRKDGHIESESAETVIISIPAKEAAGLISPLSPAAAAILASISYASLASVALGFDRTQVGHALDGFGFLVPRVEGVRTLGGLFSSSLFARRAPGDQVLVTAFIGGAQDKSAMELDDQELLKQVSSDLSGILGIQGTPGFALVNRHERAIPQYAIGHLDRIADLDRLTEPLPGLHLQASWRGGVSVADCIKNGEMLAQSIAATRQKAL